MAAAAYVRKDGRQALEMRGKELKVSELSHFDGSSFYAQGMSCVSVAIHGPTAAKKEEDYEKCSLRIRILHAASVPQAGGADHVNMQERKRETSSVLDASELESLIERAVGAVFIAESFPTCVLTIDVVVTYDDGSLAAAAVNATMCALLDAGLPCRTTMAAVAVAVLEQPLAQSATTTTTTTATAAFAAAASSSSSLLSGTRLYLLDPTKQEESLGGSSTLAMTTTTTTAPTTVAVAVFVLLNPSCGGGILASHVHRTPFASRTTPMMIMSSGDGAVGNDGSQSASAAAARRNVSVQELAQLVTLAERAAPALFEFFRQCNVPLE